MSNTITVNGVEYIRADSVPAAKPNGNRAVVVVDRGWIFAGDVTREDGRIGELWWINSQQSKKIYGGNIVQGLRRTYVPWGTCGYGCDIKVWLDPIND